MTNAPPASPAPVVRCACGLVHLPASWLALPFVGLQADGLGGQLELRNCPCGSTHGVVVPRLAKCGAPAAAPPPPRRPGALSPAQRREVASLVEDGSYSRREATAWVRAFGGAS